MGKKLFTIALCLLLGVGAAFAQKGTVTGVVRDASTGEVIPFASIMEKGTMNGISSGEDGVYSITVSDAKSSVLVFSSVGYVSAEVGVAEEPRWTFPLRLTMCSTM